MGTACLSLPAPSALPALRFRCQGFVGLGNVGELLVGAFLFLFAGVLVRVPLHGQLVVRCFDLLGVGVPGHAQRSVVVFLRGLLPSVIVPVIPVPLLLLPLVLLLLLLLPLPRVLLALVARLALLTPRACNRIPATHSARAKPLKLSVVVQDCEEVLTCH